MNNVSIDNNTTVLFRIDSLISSNQTNVRQGYLFSGQRRDSDQVTKETYTSG